MFHRGTSRFCGPIHFFSCLRTNTSVLCPRRNYKNCSFECSHKKTKRNCLIEQRCIFVIQYFFLACESTLTSVLCPRRNDKNCNFECPHPKTKGISVFYRVTLHFCDPIFFSWAREYTSVLCLHFFLHCWWVLQLR
jgi:hypothetical protein